MFCRELQFRTRLLCGFRNRNNHMQSVFRFYTFLKFCITQPLALRIKWFTHLITLWYQTDTWTMNGCYWSHTFLNNYNQMHMQAKQFLLRNSVWISRHFLSVCSEWSDWSVCSATCNGMQTRNRHCKNSTQENDQLQARPCNTQPCGKSLRSLVRVLAAGSSRML